MTQKNNFQSSHDHTDMIGRPFRHYITAHRRPFTAGIIALFFTNLLDVLTPLALKEGLDAVSANSHGRLMNSIGAYVILMVGVTFFRYSWRVYIGRFHHSVAHDLRRRIFSKLTTLGPRFFSQAPTGQLMSLITNDVNTFRMAIGPGLLILVDSLYYVVMILPMMVYLNWDWTWKTLILLPVVPFLIRKMETLIHVRSRVQQDRLSDLSGRAQEIVSGIRVIKSYAQEENQTLRFDQCSKVYEDACNKLAKADSAFHPLMESIIAIGSVTLLWFCSEPVIQDQMTIGTFVAFHEYVRRMVWPMSAIGMSVSMIEQGRASFDRIVDLLKTETDTPDFGKSKLAKLKKISIENLSFRYPTSDRNALSKINLNISAGEVIGLVGSVGAGKTTLLQLLTRLYSVTEGTIQYNGIQIQDISRDELTNKISYVTQDAFLFSDTIASNIALGLPEQDTVPEEFNEMPPHSIVEAANVVNMHEEIHDIPGGYGAYIGERGVSLSGGQKQRLTIARALVRDSEFIILDDSLSAVDAKTEQSIVQALRSALDEEDGENQAKTVIIASHRLATLRHAHRIVVLDQGQIEAVGSHDELLGASPTYRAMYDLQSSHLNSESDLNSNTLQLPSEPRTRKANGYNQSIPT